ncbi:MAG: hypothetical protein JST30_01845 [Armatimonadetes bacterium]|nr:hypothetical protein [Armatimonadota bacterium]
MDGLTPVRGPDPGGLYRNAVRPTSDRNKKPAKPARHQDEDETGLDDAEDQLETQGDEDVADDDGHGIDLQA